MKRRLLTVKDLYDFLENQNQNLNFTASQSGYEISVSSPGYFEVKEYKDDEGLIYCNLKAFHDLSNANKSFIDQDVFKKRAITMKNRPIMADIVDVDDGNGGMIKDFSGHTMYYDEEKGKNVYVEVPVGHVINPENIRVEYDQEYDRDFAMADCVIYEEYTDTCDILRRRKKVDCSVELCIRELSFDSSTKELRLDDYYVQGITLLGETVLPGMKGSNITLKDFSMENNSTYFNKQNIINEVTNAVLERLSNKQAEFSAEEKTTRKEEINPVDNENVNVEFEEAETAEVEEAKVKLEEAEAKPETEEVEEATEEEKAGPEADEAEEDAEETPEVVDDFADDDEEDDEPSEDEDHQSVSAIEDEDSTGTKVENSLNSINIAVGEKTFELSLDDVNYSLNCLVNDMYSETDNTYYMTVVYPESKHVVMVDAWNSCRAYKQSYKDRKGVYSLVGERIPVRSMWVTADEEAELDKLRSNYSAIESELNDYKFKELHSRREEIMAAEEYAVLKNDKDFKELKDNMDDYSVDDLSNKADLIFAKFMKSHKNFSAKAGTPAQVVFMGTGADNTNEAKLPYGGLFKDFKSKK